MNIQAQLTSIIKNYKIHSKGLNKSSYRNNRGRAHAIHGIDVRFLTFKRVMSPHNPHTKMQKPSKRNHTLVTKG